MHSSLRQLSWAGALGLALFAVLAASLSAAAGSPVATADPPATESPDTTDGPPTGEEPIYQSLVDARGGREPAHPGPIPIDDIRRILTEESKKAAFDGVVRGWRLAPLDTLLAEDLSRDLSRECEPETVSSESKTQLDFTLTYIPEQISIREDSQVTKWVCDGDALFVNAEMTVDTPLGEGILMVYRAIWGARDLDLQAPYDRVSEGTINGRPAIFVRPADSKFGLGTEQIIVIEDDAGPEYKVLRVFADNGIPFDELVRLAEGIR